MGQIRAAFLRLGAKPIVRQWRASGSVSFGPAPPKDSTELDLIDTLIERAGFRSRVVKQYSIFIEFIRFIRMHEGFWLFSWNQWDARSLTLVRQCDLNLPADRRGI